MEDVTGGTGLHAHNNSRKRLPVHRFIFIAYVTILLRIRNISGIPVHNAVKNS
jgi:hypothetical protein